MSGGCLGYTQYLAISFQKSQGIRLLNRSNSAFAMAVLLGGLATYISLVMGNFLPILVSYFTLCRGLLKDCSRCQTQMLPVFVNKVLLERDP